MVRDRIQSVWLVGAVGIELLNQISKPRVFMFATPPPKRELQPNGAKLLCTLESEYVGATYQARRITSGLLVIRSDGHSHASL